MWDFLEREGYLTNDATSENIAEGKKAYRNWYKREHKKRYRKEHPEITVIFPDKESFAFIKQKAKDHKLSMSSFLRICTEKYLEQQYVQVNDTVWQSIDQNLQITELHIKKIMELVEDGNYSTKHAYDLLLQNLLELKAQVESTLYKPELLQDAIKNIVIKEPWHKESLLHFIQTL